MINRFNNKFRISSTRLPHWDYSSAGYYFITICTKNKEPYFGEIKDGKMFLNKMGGIVKKCTEEIPNHYQNTNLDIYSVIPNHLHMILIINNVETCYSMSLQINNKFGKPKSGSLSMIINRFKGTVTRLCMKDNIPFSWQSNYYEHIIRNDRELFEIREYIENNPLKWELDEENPEKNNSAISGNIRQDMVK